MMRKQIPILILMCILIFLNACKQQSKHQAQGVSQKPNVILFVSDDHGIDALGCYGNKVIETPNMDQLATDGIRFTNAYCTSASCAASRSVILSGKYGHSTGSYGHTHDYHHFSTFDTIKTLPVLLEQAGYHTARIGKYHLAPEKVYHFKDVLKADPRNTVEMADKCKGVINANSPFFLYFCTDDPHRGAPFKPERWDMPNRFGNTDNGYDGVESHNYNPDDVEVPPYLPDNKQCREEIAEYYQSINRIDQGLGKLLSYVEQAGKTDNTIIIYISDNGMAFPGAKTTVYEPGIKLPCIIKNPFASKQGVVNNAFLSWLDLTPSILDFCKVDYNKKQFHGKSFMSILEQQNPPGWDEVYASHTFHEITMYYPMRAYRKGKFKLIYNIAYQLQYPFASDLWASSTWQAVYRNKEVFYGQRLVKDYLYHAEFELYNLEEDPYESKNLALNPAYKTQLEEMKQALKAFQVKTNDPWQIVWGNESLMQGSGVNL